MLFNSQLFVLAFLPASLAAFYAAPGLRSRQAVLIAASLLFYGCWDWRFVPALAGLTLAVWLVTRAFQATGWRWLPLAGVALCLLVLGVCKYADFAGETLAGLTGGSFAPFGFILPLGISFFTFQKISYLLDLRRGDRHFYGLREFFAFVTFFPQLIAGPIVRHDELMPQWRVDPRGPAMWENIGRGLMLFTIGFAKKAGIADTIAPIVDPLFAQAATAPLGAGQAWVAAGGFALQIYFDFSGYSDMAIGLGLMFGLRLPFNFDAPFRACSVRETWRRWHMTLSRFLRDYVYVPLGGNRAGPGAQARNVLATMLLGGLWHGAAWTFVVWGGLQGVALAGHAAFARRGGRLPAGAGWALTTLFFVASFVFFRAESFGAAGRVLRAMAGWGDAGGAMPKGLWILPVAALVAVAGPTSQAVALGRMRPVAWLAVPAGVALVGLLLLSGGRGPSEFIYFQF